jgi:hypothetical protein
MTPPPSEGEAVRRLLKSPPKPFTSKDTGKESPKPPKAPIQGYERRATLMNENG